MSVSTLPAPTRNDVLLSTASDLCTQMAELRARLLQLEALAAELRGAETGAASRAPAPAVDSGSATAPDHGPGRAAGQEPDQATTAGWPAERARLQREVERLNGLVRVYPFAVCNSAPGGS